VVRIAYQSQHRFDSSPIANLSLNIECRDEVIPILVGLQHLYTDSTLRNKVVKLVAADLSEGSRRDVGRPGMDDWQDSDGFTYRRIRDTLCRLKPETISKLNQTIVSAGQAIHGDASEYVRADSFVIETNIHYPTESNLIWDGVRKFMPVCVELAETLDLAQWRPSKHLLTKIKKLTQTIGRISASKSPRKKDARCDGVHLRRSASAHRPVALASENTGRNGTNRVVLPRNDGENRSSGALD